MLALETADRASIEVQQLARLQAGLAHLLPSNRVPVNRFYQHKLDANGTGARIETLADLARLPFTTKHELVDDQAAHPIFGSNLTYPLSAYIRLHQTSGTTGQPLKILDTQQSWDWWAECWTSVYRAAGVSENDSVFLAFGFGPFIGFWSAYEGAKRLGALVVPGGGMDSVQRLRAMQEVGATVLVCTPSYALRLAEVAQEHGMDMRQSTIRVTIHAGEPGASIPATRQRIERAWGAKSYDHAGMTEMGAYGYECAEQAGLHVNESEFIAEVIDPATSAPADEGELVLTNLGRTGSPAIRYRTGDRVRTAAGPCGCGRSFVRLAGGILGRLDDMLIVRGVNVFPSAIEGIVRRFAAVEEFQVEVCRDGELDEVHLLVEAGDETLLRPLQEALRADLGIRLDVRAVPPRTLPRHELKARRVVKKYLTP